MCVGGNQQQPVVPALPSPPKAAPKRVSADVTRARNDIRSQIRAAKGRSDTIKTSSRGLEDEDANTKSKTLGGK